jgi:hypothetical protein
MKAESIVIDNICINKADQKYCAGDLMIIGTCIGLQNGCSFIKSLSTVICNCFSHSILLQVETSAQNNQISQKTWGRASVNDSYGALLSLKVKFELKSSYFRFRLYPQPVCYHDRLTW